MVEVLEGREEEVLAVNMIGVSVDSVSLVSATVEEAAEVVEFFGGVRVLEVVDDGEVDAGLAPAIDEAAKTAAAWEAATSSAGGAVVGTLEAGFGFLTTRRAPARSSYVMYAKKYFCLAK